MRKCVLWLGSCVVVIALTSFPPTVRLQNAPSMPPVPREISAGLQSISGDEMLTHIKALASDEFEGRAPGTRGETLTVNYLVEQFKRSGLKPGNPDGSYIQKVPLVGFTSVPSAAVKVGGKPFELNFPDDYVALSRRLVPEVAVESADVIFVGYGIVAREYGWDDYKNIDVRGKTLIMLEGEPQITDPRDPAKPDDSMFRGRTLTYYSTRTYKFELAAQKGAAAAFLIPNPASQYSFKSHQDRARQEMFEIKRKATSPPALAAEGWITFDAVKRLGEATGQDINRLIGTAMKIDFKPVRFERATAALQVKSKLREFESHNVVARVEGSDAVKKDEYVIYTAHWDHLGRDESLKGDQIYNGAIDNAAGTAQMLAIAKGFAKLAKPPRRSVLFIATTAEERGFGGAKYYTANPLYPLHRTLANINLDACNLWGRTVDVINLGFGATTLDDVLAESAEAQKRVFVKESVAGGVYFFLSDQFEFARAGVPAVFPGSGSNYVGKPAEFGDAKWNDYGSKDYHQVSDEVRADWDMSGAVEDAQWLLQVGYRVAQAAKFPEWNPGSEFKAKRDEMLTRTSSRSPR